MSKTLDEQSSGLEANIIMRIGKALQRIRKANHDGYIVETVKVFKFEDNNGNNTIEIETGDEHRLASEIYWEWVNQQMSDNPELPKEKLG